MADLDPVGTEIFMDAWMENRIGLSLIEWSFGGAKNSSRRKGAAHDAGMVARWPHAAERVSVLPVHHGIDSRHDRAGRTLGSCQ